jgi:hypothetical protein
MHGPMNIKLNMIDLSVVKIDALKVIIYVRAQMNVLC